MAAIKKFFLTLLVISAFCSCSSRKGYFVAVWPPENSIVKSGEVATVISQSDIRNVYVIEKTKKEREELPKYTGKFFKWKKDALKFLKDYTPYINMFAFAGRNAVIRKSLQPNENAAAAAQTEREYRMKENQTVKIISKLPDVVTINDVTGNMFYIVTDDGFDGYCFEKSLTVYERDSAVSKESGERNIEELLFNNIWYPLAYFDAIAEDQFALDNIRTGEGFFPNKAAKKIVIQTSKERLEYNYTGINFIDDKTIALSGTPVDIMFYPGNRIYVKYSHNGIDYLRYYTLLDKPLEKYIEQEVKRRNEVVDKFIKRAKYLVSDLYGTIEIRSNRKFTWTGYVNLVPDVIPYGYGNSGLVRCNYILPDSLKKEYDGVLSFVFDKISKEMVFCYFFVDDGVRFTHIPAEYIEKGFVTGIPETPNVYFFRHGSKP